ncbi:hypothetical protein pipiens_019657, partial [Culex pipiens pipiens]
HHKRVSVGHTVSVESVPYFLLEKFDPLLGESYPVSSKQRAEINGDLSNRFLQHVWQITCSSSGSELDDKSVVQTPANVTTTAASTTTTTTVANKLDLTQALTSEDALYEVSGTELQFLSVEKVIENKLAAPGLAGYTQDLTGIDSSKQSSNGSMGSLGPFQLPSARPAADSHSSATDSSGTISSQSKAPLFKVKHTVRGVKALESLMIEDFTKIKRALSKDDDAELDQSSSNAKTPKTNHQKGWSRKKRTRTKSEVEASLLEERQEADTGHTRTCRAGTASEPGRLVVLYGAVVRPKVLRRQGHAFTGGGTYETGFVDEVKRNETTNEVSYVVRIGEGTVEVTASDLYLNEEQAKYINRACKAAEDPMQSPSANG